MKSRHWYFASGACACNAFWSAGQGMSLVAMAMVLCAVVYWHEAKNG